MDLDQFLDFHGVDLPSIQAAIIDRVDWRPGEVLYLSGSVLDGIGNTTSDLDAFLITDRPIEQCTFDRTIILPLQSFAVDLEIHERQKVSDLIRLIGTFSPDEDRDPRSSLCFNQNDLAFLHRLVIGKPVSGLDQFYDLQRTVDPRAITRIIFDQAAAIIPAQATDILGLLEANDVDSAGVSAQRLLGCTIDAILAVQGNSNPAQKWRLRKLRQVSEVGWNYALPRELMGMSSYGAWRDLFLMRGRDCENLVEYSYRCVQLGRHIIPWGQQIFVDSPVTKQGTGVDRTSGTSPASISKLVELPVVEHASILTEPLPRLMVNVMARRGSGQICLSGPRSSMELVIGELMLAALFYFDGKTTINTAVEQLAEMTTAGRTQLAQTFLDLKTVLAHYGFLAEPSDQVRLNPWGPITI